MSRRRGRRSKMMIEILFCLCEADLSDINSNNLQFFLVQGSIPPPFNCFMMIDDKER